MSARAWRPLVLTSSRISAQPRVPYQPTLARFLRRLRAVIACHQGMLAYLLPRLMTARPGGDASHRPHEPVVNLREVRSFLMGPIMRRARHGAVIFIVVFSLLVI